MENIYRNEYCGKVDASYENKEVRLSGWIDTIRNLGALVFITLRDETGLVQLISNNVEEYSKLNRESTVTVEGIVRKRKVEQLLNILFSSSAVRFEPYIVRKPFSTFSFLNVSAWKIDNAIKKSGKIDNAVIFMVL